MKPIKFRAWDKLNNRWIDPYKIYFDKDRGECAIADINEEIYGLHQIELLQFTGLLDKNNQPIYECDIVKCPITDQAANYLLLEAGNKDYVLRVISIPECYQEGLPDDCEVIGNTFQNPKLIKEQP